MKATIHKKILDLFMHLTNLGIYYKYKNYSYELLKFYFLLHLLQLALSAAAQDATALLLLPAMVMHDFNWMNIRQVN